MPIYEYVCSDCDSKFELRRSMSQSNEKADCPRCQHKSERVLSKFACFSTDSSGNTAPVSGGGGSSCSCCSSGNCSTCAS